MAEKKKARREFLKSFGLILSVPMIGSGWYAWATNPRVERNTEFIPIGQDGTPVRAYKLEDLPPEAVRDPIITTCVFYVMLRESYASGMADYAWRVISALSTETVWKEYESSHDPRNADSPWKKYGTNTVVTFDYDSHDDLTLPYGYRGPPPGYLIRFWRTIKKDGVVIDRAMWGASLRINRNVKTIDPRQRYEFNPGSIQVWEYVSRPIGPQNPQGR